MSDVPPIQILSLNPLPPPRFWSSKVGAWLVPFGMAIFIYLFSFVTFALTKPALILKNPSSSSGVETEEEQDAATPSHPSQGEEEELVAESQSHSEANPLTVPLSQIHSVLKTSELFLQSSPLAKYALSEARNALGGEKKLGQILAQLDKRQAVKCWEAKAIDWNSVAGIAAIPAGCFLLLVAAAL